MPKFIALREAVQSPDHFNLFSVMSSITLVNVSNIKLVTTGGLVATQTITWDPTGRKEISIVHLLTGEVLNYAESVEEIMNLIFEAKDQ